MEKYPKFSVLISVYAKNDSNALDKCLESVFSQTLVPDEMVLVCDGPLTAGLDSVINKYVKKYGNIFRVVRIKKNVGTGAAANIGIKACRNELILKADSDDICLPDRCRIQAEMFAKDPELAMAGGYIREFSNETGEEIAVKKVPLTHEEIMKYSRRRNPINNPSIAIKRSFAIKIGGYSRDVRCEDYDFVCRMLHSGAKAANTPEILVDYRVDKGNMSRRRDWRNTKSFVAVRWKNFLRGYCGLLDLIIPCAAQIMLFLMPEKLTEKFYGKFLRKQ